MKTLTTKKKIHYLPHYLQNPSHPITVCLIGCGGTGSSLITKLAQIDFSLKAMDRPGLHVTVYDGDEISQANIGRQMFSPVEIGLNKAVALTTRLNRFYGNNWEAVPENFTKKTATEHNIYITCVDTAKARTSIGKLISRKFLTNNGPYIPYYWMDTGNTKDTGQVILGTLREIKQPDESSFDCQTSLPTILDKYPDMALNDKEEIQGPSCSVAESLHKQDLFINATIAQLASSMLWTTLKQGFTIYSGVFTNLSTMNTNPSPL